MPDFKAVLADLSLGNDFFTLVLKVCKNFADPNTPDNKAQEIKAIEQIALDRGKSPALAHEYGVVLTDVTSAFAGADDAVDSIMADIKRDAPTSLDEEFEAALRDALTKIEAAVKRFRQGKPMGG